MATPAFLVRLMAYTRLSGGIRLSEEDRIAISFANALRAATLEGRLMAVWTHPANELAGVGRRVRGVFQPTIQSAIARACGLITGTPDYLFLCDGGSLAIEIKTSIGSLSPAQRDFRDWCARMGVPHHVCRSVEESLDVLRKAGIYWDERPAA